MYAQQGANPFAVLVLEIHAVSAQDTVVDTGFLNFETSGVNQ